MNRPAILAAGILLVFVGPATAQSPDVLYTWDHALGPVAGDSVEGWSSGGANIPALSNATDGVLTITESAAGGDWNISDHFNVAKESAAHNLASPTNLAFDFGGIDLLGLDTIAFDIQHDGAGTYNGQARFQPDDGGGCCGFYTVPLSVAPGPQTVVVDLNASGMSPAEFKYVRSFGLEIFGNAEASPLTWSLSEIRSGGTPLVQRTIADHSLGLENAVVKFDELAIQDSTGTESQDGLSIVGDALRWIDLGGTGDPGDESGGAVAWGNNNALAVDFLARPLDTSNYSSAVVRMAATPGSGGANLVDVQFFAQYADRAIQNADANVASFAFQAPGLQTLAADGQFHDLVFPLGGLVDLDLVQWLGVNLSPHAGGNLQIQVASVTLIPEPASGLLLLLAGGGVMATRRSAN